MGSETVLMPWLNNWLLKKEQPIGAVKTEVAKRLHPVPSGPKEMAGSQNLFLLELGCDAALNGLLSSSVEQELIARLERERDTVGLWGSECTSPIYHHFTITGLSAIYHNTNNEHLKDLIEQNLGSFFWYALRMGLDKSKHGLIGMRGTGFDFASSGFPDLHFVCQYFTSGRPKNYTELSSWKPMFKDSGWAFSSVAGGRNYELYKKAFEYAVDNSWKPWRLRSKLTFVRVDGVDAGHFYERGINGNTPAIIAYVNKSNMYSYAGYLPTNLDIRVRQKQDNSIGGYEIKDTTVVFTYSGVYTSLTNGGGGDTQTLVHYGYKITKVEVLTSSLDGVTGWVQVYPSASVPSDSPQIPLPAEQPNNANPPQKKRKPWWMFW